MELILGLLASMIEPTNIEGILKVDLNANDYYVDKDEERPLFLMFNPHEQEQIIQYQVKTEGTVDLYDLVNQTFIEKNVSKQADVKIKSTDAVIVLEIPVDEGDNEYKINRKLERSVTAEVPAAVNIIGISEYEPLSDNYPIDLEIKSVGGVSVSDITIYIDGRVVFQNANYTKPYVIDVEKLENGYHI